MPIKRIFLNLLFIGIPVFAVLGISNFYLQKSESRLQQTTILLEDSRKAHLYSEQMYFKIMMDIECSIRDIKAKDRRVMNDAINTYRGILETKLTENRYSETEKAEIEEALMYVPLECK